MSKRYTHLLVFLFLLLVVVLSDNCNASHMSFVSTYSLGKQDELNRTFTKIQEKIPLLEEVSYQVPSGPTYREINVKPTFYYRDSNQRATFRGEDVIIIDGGKLEVDIKFSWSKQSTSTINGTGMAAGLSYELMIGKKLVIDGNSYSYQLLDSMPFVMPEQNAFNLTRIDPPGTTAADQQILLQMLNGLKDDKDLKSQLQDQINKIYNYYLNASLHDKHFPIDTQFDYHWTAAGRNFTIPFVRRPTSVDIQSFGLISTFDVQVGNASNWHCGTRKVFQMPLDPKLFGGIQEYISLDFYENVVEWALGNSLFDSELRQETWGNRMFQFFAGDLYEVFQRIQSKYYASEPVSGVCQGSRTGGVKVYMNNNSTFNVTLKFDCGLKIRTEDIVKFSLSLQLTVAGRPGLDTLDFQLVSHQQTANFVPQGEYILTNKPLAEALLSDSLNRLYESKLFGSGWPQSPPRDYPHFRVMQNFTSVLDSSHIDASLASQLLQE